MSGNPASNCLRVLIVCSLIRHISKFSSTETIYKNNKLKKVFFDVWFYNLTLLSLFLILLIMISTKGSVGPIFLTAFTFLLLFFAE